MFNSISCVIRSEIDTLPQLFLCSCRRATTWSRTCPRFCRLSSTPSISIRFLLTLRNRSYRVDLCPHIHVYSYMCVLILSTLYVIHLIFSSVQAKNLLILYDAVGTLAASVGGNLADAGVGELLMQPLMHKWNTLSDDHRVRFKRRLPEIS